MAYATTTLETLIEEVHDFLSDVGQERFNAREIVSAANNTLRDVWPTWYEVTLDETLTYAKDTISYTVPTAIERVTEVHIQRDDTDEPWFEVTGWEIRGTTIYFKRKYRDFDGNTLRVTGEGRPTLFQAIKGNTGVADGTTTWTDANATFTTDGVAANDTLYIVQSGNNDAAVGKFTVSSVDSETQLTLGSGPASASNCIYVVVDKTDSTTVPYAYLLHMVSFHLYQLWGHRGVGKDVDMATRWANYHFEQAELTMSRQRKRKFG